MNTYVKYTRTYSVSVIIKESSYFFNSLIFRPLNKTLNRAFKGNVSLELNLHGFGVHPTGGGGGSRQFQAPPALRDVAQQAVARHLAAHFGAKLRPHGGITGGQTTP